MKIGLFIALLVLVASTDVFGQKTRERTDGSRTRSNRPKTNDDSTDQVQFDDDNLNRHGTTPDKIVIHTEHDDQRVKNNPVDSKVIRKPTGRDDTEREDAKPVAIVREETKPTVVEVIHKPDEQVEIKEGHDSSDMKKPVTQSEDDAEESRDEKVTPSAQKSFGKPTENDEEPQEEKVTPSAQKSFGKPTENDEEPQEEKVKPSAQRSSSRPQEDKVRPDAQRSSRRPQEEKVTPDAQGSSSSPPQEEEEDSASEEHPAQMHTEDVPEDDETKERKPVVAVPVTDHMQVSDNTVHVSGHVVLVKYRSSAVDSVQYDLDGARLINGGRPLIQSHSPFAQDLLAHQSRVTLFVSTSKTTDRKLAFAQFPIKFERDHFPLSFDIDVQLPNQQRGLLERADITLYFFVYITNLETRIDTFFPAGTSQILLQGTNRLVQKLDVYVKASGIEINGLFRGRFGQRFIRPGTAFQVFIIPEESLGLLQTQTFESVAQLTINNVPAMYPVPFSLLVNLQSLKPNTKYFAVAYILQNGLQRLINQQPIYVINKQKVLLAPQVIFTVIPSPFILRGSVTRSMPGSFYLQPRSSLILRLHEIGSDSRDIIFKLPEIVTLPQVFQINVSEAIRFDPSKNYDVRALITDEKNDIYMASLQPIPLPDELSRLIVPVDDLLYYVQVHLHASSNQQLSYIPGSTAQVFVTESPETPTKPIVAIRIDSLASDFHDFSIQVPATAIQRGRNYYLVMMIEVNGMITHVSKTLLISNNQPPPLVIQLPVLSLNLITGVIFDVENRPAQWSSSSYANLYLLDDKAEDPDKAIVQVWKIHLENDFPVRFEVQLDFSRLRPDHVYRLQGAIENGRNILEYKPAGSVLALNPNGGIITDVRIPVHNVKTFQSVQGLIYINDLTGPLPEKSEIIIQLSSTPSLSHPSIIDEIRIKVEGRELPVNFTMNLPLNKIDITSVYYFLVQYVVRDNVIIPASQAFAFSPRNEATVVLTLSKTPQIPITGQVTSTGSPLLLPIGATLHLYITNNPDSLKPIIISEAFLQASSNSLYEFTMNIDSVILQKKIPLYLRADIIYHDGIILSIPRPALLQITPGGEWNINLVVDLPTLLIGEIVSMSQHEHVAGEFEVFVQILESGTSNIVHTSRLRLDADLPQQFRIELDNELFVQYPRLQARAIIKNCKEQTLFESGGVIDIHAGLNVKVILPVVLTNPQKFKELTATVNEIAPLQIGVWRLSVTGTVTGPETGASATNDNDSVSQNQ